MGTKKQCDSVICQRPSVFQLTFLDGSRINLCFQHYEELKKHITKKNNYATRNQ